MCYFLYSIIVCPKWHIVYFGKWIVCTRLTSIGKDSISTVRWRLPGRGLTSRHQVHWLSRASAQAISKWCHELVLGHIGPAWSGISLGYSRDPVLHVPMERVLLFSFYFYALCSLLSALRRVSKQNTGRWKECSQLMQVARQGGVSGSIKASSLWMKIWNRLIWTSCA